MPLSTVLCTSFQYILLLMIVAWIVSLVRGKACVVDSFWGLGFIIAAWTAYIHGPGTSRGLLVALLVTIWALRLIAHVTHRNWGKPEDRRYQAMRDHHGPRFWLVSLFTVFLLQAAILWVVSLGPQLAQLAPRPEHLTWLDGLGILIFVVGLTFEAVGDWQMERFKQDPGNVGKVMDQGLWAYTRHPNYFGESLVWWGIFCIALATPYWWAAWISPVLITLLLLKVSGVAMLEKDIADRRPGYAVYKRKVNAFIPGFPSKW
ncbi:MAG: DUF1295 domain-containing protein [Desulfovibrionales bacterium]|nr:MAG: DUF1295 domain-containing protein [Desulfovibrionales bacterium]